jgi:hypothetical protein
MKMHNMQVGGPGSQPFFFLSSKTSMDCWIDYHYHSKSVIMHTPFSPHVLYIVYCNFLYQANHNAVLDLKPRDPATVQFHMRRTYYAS